MKIIRAINILLLSLFILMVVVGLAKAATIKADSCSRAHVVAAIASASAGDTIQIPAGTCNTDWTSVVDVSKPLTIQGAGQGVTVITANITATSYNNYVFSIPGYVTETLKSNPYGANQTVYAAGRWTFKDMTINAQYKSGHFFFQNVSDDFFQLHLTNLTLSGCQKVPSSGFNYRNTIAIYGKWEGLVNRNTLSGNPYVKYMGPLYHGYHIYNVVEPTMSTADATIYFEDNVISGNTYNSLANTLGVCTGSVTSFTLDGITGTSACGTDCDCDGGQVAISTNNATQWVWRYNTITTDSTHWGVSMYFDHGPRGSDSSKYYSSTLSSGETVEGLWYQVVATQTNHFCTGCVAGSEFKATSSAKTIDANNTVKIITFPMEQGVLASEVYGNDFRMPYNSSSGSRSAIQRLSGYGMVFNNQVTRAGSGDLSIARIYYGTQWPDVRLGDTYQVMKLCPTDSEHLYGGSYTCTGNGVPQHVYRSYDWNNRYNNSGVTGTIMGSVAGVSDSNDAQYLPPVANQNFWSHNAACTSSSCSSGTGCGSATPTGTCTTGVGYWKTTQSCDAIQSGTIGAYHSVDISGTFYRCTDTDTWTVYYTPLQYPHPWVGSDVTAPVTVEGTVYPTGQVACSGDSANFDLGFTVVEASGSVYGKCCLASGSCDTSTAYADMTMNMDVSGLALSVNDDWPCGADYTVYCRTIDASLNESATTTIGFQTEANSDTTPPTLSSQSLGVNGRTLTLTFSEPVKYGAGGTGGWTLTAGGSSVDITYVSGADSTVLVYQTASCITAGAVTLDFAQPGNGIEDQAGNDFATIGDAVSVTNNSTQSCGAATSLFYPDVLTYTTHTDVASNLGMRFQTSVAGNLTDVCYYKDATLTGTHTASVWDDSCTLLGSKAIGSDTGTGWKCQTLDTAIPLLADTYYRVAVHFPTSAYIKVNNFFANAYTESNLTVAAGGGRYYDSATTGCPSSTTNSNFLVDFIIAYAGASGPWNVTVSKTGAGCSIDSQPTTAIVDTETAEVVTTVNNGWGISVAGTCGGSGSLSGNTYTWTTDSVTADCTIAITCAEINLAPFVIP